jgi:hypothetical protein
VRLIAITDGVVQENFLDEAKKIHCAIAEAVATALGSSAYQVLKMTDDP